MTSGVRQVDEKDVPYDVRHCSVGGCKQKHTWWSVEVDGIDDLKPDDDDKAVVAMARRWVRKATDVGVEVDAEVFVIAHEPEPRRKAVLTSLTDDVRMQRKWAKERQAREARAAYMAEHGEEIAAENRRRNLERIGREVPHWPVPGEVWRRVADDVLVEVTWVDGWDHGRNKNRKVNFQTETRVGQCPLGTFIAEFRWYDVSAGRDHD